MDDDEEQQSRGQAAKGHERGEGVNWWAMGVKRGTCAIDCCGGGATSSLQD